ncbi:putative proteasome activator subunit 1 (PA28 alpha) [Monocercomonoides exilis]|uniref:putative proteasome activator subunit 1 (PA28 alpha) n=1 Tax=Monocercomonoides exilis TaxID=2049356 RepID=UPI00355A7482|nr:putative proteasome activator subunit 1 (PA28 alpha) [Monocercomonoides exilis]
MALKPSLVRVFSNFQKECKENSLKSADEARIELLKEQKELTDLANRVTSEYEKIVEGCELPQNIASEEATKEPILTNQKYVELTKEVTKHINKLLSIYRSIKMWIKLNVESVSNSETFVFQVQEEVLEILNGAEDSTEEFLTNMSDYHTERSEITSKIQLYPQYENLVHQLKYFDKKSATEILVSIKSLGDDASQIIDLIQKNEEYLTIKK